MEEGSPVDVVGEFTERLVFDSTGASELGLWWGVVVPAVGGDELIGLSFGEGDDFFLGAIFEGGACLFMLGIVCGHKFFTLFFGKKGRGDWDGARGIENVYERTAVVRSHLDGSVG